MIIRRCKGWGKNPPHKKPLYSYTNDASQWYGCLPIFGKMPTFTDCICPSCEAQMRLDVGLTLCPKKAEENAGEHPVNQKAISDVFNPEKHERM